jgi:hypothetical protein
MSTETETTTPNPADTPAVTLSVAGVDILARIIAVCTARGAFKANELSTIGPIYDKLVEALPTPPPATHNPDADGGPVTDDIPPQSEQLELPLND